MKRELVLVTNPGDSAIAAYLLEDESLLPMAVTEPLAGSACTPDFGTILAKCEAANLIAAVAALAM